MKRRKWDEKTKATPLCCKGSRAKRWQSSVRNIKLTKPSIINGGTNSLRMQGSCLKSTSRANAKPGCTKRMRD